MDLGGTANKIIDKIGSHAEILAALGGMLARQMEVYPGNLGGAIGGLVDYATNTGTGGMMEEVLKTVQDPQYLVYKVFTSNHVYSGLVKAGLAAYIAGEFGIIPSKWQTIGKKVAMGGAIAAIISQGSGPRPESASVQQNFAMAPMQGAYY